MKKRKAPMFSFFRYQCRGRYSPVRPPLSKNYQEELNVILAMRQAAQKPPLSGEVGLFDLPVVNSVRAVMEEA